MKPTKILPVIFLLLGSFLAAQNSQIKSTSITIYNQNIGIVKETRSLNLQKGISITNLVDVAQLIDPTTVKIGFDGEVIEQNYQYDLVSMDKILQRYIDKEVQLLGDKGELIEGVLLSCYGNQAVIKKKEGGLTLLPNISQFRFAVGELPKGLITRPTLQCMFAAEKTGQQDINLSYQTGGMTWHAEYVAVLDKPDKKMDLNSWVSVANNCGTAFQDAELKLVAGDVNMVNQGHPILRENSDMMYMTKASQPQFEEKSFFEYHIYKLQRHTNLSNNETKQVSLFEKEGITVKKKYLFETSQYLNNNEKVSVVISFKNEEKSNLGVPMPKGKIRIFKSDGTSLEFIGEDAIDHTAKDEELNLHIGNAFDVSAKAIQTDYRKITDRIYETSYKVTINNHKTESITVDVRHNAGVLWTMKENSLAFVKEDAAHILFQPEISAGGEKEITFTLRYQN